MVLSGTRLPSSCPLAEPFPCLLSCTLPPQGFELIQWPSLSICLPTEEATKGGRLGVTDPGTLHKVSRGASLEVDGVGGWAQEVVGLWGEQVSPGNGTVITPGSGCSDEQVREAVLESEIQGQSVTHTPDLAGQPGGQPSSGSPRGAGQAVTTIKKDPPVESGKVGRAGVGLRTAAMVHEWISGDVGSVCTLALPGWRTRGVCVCTKAACRSSPSLGGRVGTLRAETLVDLRFNRCTHLAAQHSGG